MNNIMVNKQVACGGEAPYNLVDITEANDWSTGRKGPCIGLYYTILRMADMEKQRVFVPNVNAVVSLEAVRKGVATMQFVKVDFDSLVATVSVDKNGKLRIYAEAAAVKVVTPGAVQQKVVQ